jgi:predicted O-methyltransferase YrrM
MNPILDEIYRTGKVRDEQGNVRDAYPAAVKREDGDALHALVRDSAARRSLETGMAFGVATLAICQGLQENGGGHHTSVDPWQRQWYNGIGLTNVKRAGYESMHRFFGEPSYFALPRLLEAGERFDFVFIDGNHRFEYILLDFFYAQRMLDVGGRIVLHDVWLPSVRKVMTFVVRNLAEGFAVDPRCLWAKASIGGGVARLAAALRRDIWDLFPACYFARRRFHNYVIFHKIAEIEPEEFDKKWKAYASF